MGEITTVGLDLAKRVVQLHGEDSAGRVVLRWTLKRESVLVWFAQRPPCVVGMEACASTLHFARWVIRRGTWQRRSCDRSGYRGRTMRTMRRRSARQCVSHRCAS